MNQISSFSSENGSGLDAVFVRRLTHSSRPRSGKRLRRALLMSAAALVAVGTWGWLWYGDEAALTETSRALVRALQHPESASSVTVLGETTAGAQLLEGDETRVLAKGTPPGAPTHNALTSQIAQIHNELAKEGLDWTQVHALAFGGVRAQVIDPRRMRTFATIVTGDLYLSSGKTVFALEYTARKCGSTYVITDLWRWAPLDVSMDQLSGYSNKRFREFTGEPVDPSDTTQIRRPRHLFITL